MQTLADRERAARAAVVRLLLEWDRQSRAPLAAAERVDAEQAGSAPDNVQAPEKPYDATEPPTTAGISSA